MDREAWRADIHGVAKSQTLLSDFHFHSLSKFEVYSTVLLIQFSSVAQSCPTLCNPMNCSTPGLSVHHQLLEFKLTSFEWVMPSSHLILCRPLLLLPPTPPSIKVFSNESTLCMRWPKYWSLSFSISPSNDHPERSPLEWTGCISLQSKGLSRVFSNTTVQKHQQFT